MSHCRMVTILGVALLAFASTATFSQSAASSLE
jgi:hypothetical protein